MVSSQVTKPKMAKQRAPFRALQRLNKKRAAVAGGFEVDNREASNRVDRSHSVSKRDD
jgi:hypothetical protein